MSINSFSDISAATADVVTSSTDAIVQVFGRPRRPASGFLVAPDRVVTTSHSVEWDEHTRVRAADGRVLPAEIAGRDAHSDLVLLRVPGLGQHPLSDTDTLPRTGTLALVVGRAWDGHLAATPHTLLA